MTTALDTVLAYHQRSKHQFQRYAAGPDGMDWNSQPDPFRTYAGSPRLELPLLDASAGPGYAEFYQQPGIEPQPLDLNSLAALLQLSFGISAWKQYDETRWALRCNPSSGNLHPTEAYVVAQGCAGVVDGVHHYLSRDHLLEQRCRFADGERGLPTNVILIGLTSIHWREAWKYGERAFRYCQHDVGHAIAAVRYAAATLGWTVKLLNGWSDAEIGRVLGTDRSGDNVQAEREHPDIMLQVSLQAVAEAVAPEKLLMAAGAGVWLGQANTLSVNHMHDWPAIDKVAEACAKPETQESTWQVPKLPVPLNSSCTRSAIEIIQQRRSAQSFDGIGSISRNVFFRMLDLTLPRPGIPPWDEISWAPRIDLVLFVHRVDGLEPGLYLFLRNAERGDMLRTLFSKEFEWKRVDGCPAHLPLFRLVAADMRDAARALSCHQEIAADGAFSLGMLAEYEASLALGPWVYRQLFWEAGMLGQVLYLEAEAAGVRGTGIGCFFDDGVHEALGLKGKRMQSLYHFTVGVPLTDTRLQTLPAYGHLKR
ncbi:MAG: SagB/ThcOx family dehydrogenase [Gammaproteobacteria bacterium]|nr:SagB/ThcOx family dehydrogenase [Gammaproteobacteria bacterium]MBU1979023.1 SagB/ThcOx family dehydrogenase [Gammaproteobacteria bacterium]